jgi:hypothetical protein
MSRRPAAFTQADVARAIRAAKQAGAAEVEVRTGGETSIVIRLAPSTAQELSTDPKRQIVL